MMDKREIDIDGIRIPYDCGTSIINLDNAKKAYPKHEYIGTTAVYYVNGEIRTMQHPIHFFKLK